MWLTTRHQGRRPRPAALAARGAFGVDLGLPGAERAITLPFHEVHNPVRRHPHQTRAKDRKQIAVLLGGPPGSGDGRLVGEHVGHSIHRRIQLAVLHTAVGVHPAEIRRWFWLHQPPKTTYLFRIAIEIHIRTSAANTKPRLQIFIGKKSPES